jgi:hypothetical protein
VRRLHRRRHHHQRLVKEEICDDPKKIRKFVALILLFSLLLQLKKTPKN